MLSNRLYLRDVTNYTKKYRFFIEKTVKDIIQLFKNSINEKWLFILLKHSSMSLELKFNVNLYVSILKLKNNLFVLLWIGYFNIDSINEKIALLTRLSSISFALVVIFSLLSYVELTNYHFL